MKKLLLVAFCCFIWVGLRAQTTPQMLTVKGISIDSAANKPLGYVTVALYDTASKKSIKAGLTKDDGSFQLTAPAGKPYQLVLASIGYKNKTVNISGKDAELNVGKVFLEASSKQLNEVSVTAVRPIMKREVDRISYDVQADPESKALTALDMMRKVPLLSVDANDNIKLKGNGNYKILVNGKESALVAKNPSDVLRSMPATNIERIEVITTPPAKYDAEGLAGIINIVTKKNADQGYTANISGRYNSIFGPGLNVQGSAKQGKLGITMFAGGSNNNAFVAGNSNVQQIFGGQSTTQTGTGGNQFGHHYAEAELSYEIDSLNLLTASFEDFHGRQNQTGSLFSSTFNNDGTLSQQYQQQTSGYNTFGGLDASINYQIGFKRNKDQLLTLSYKFNFSPGINTSNNTFSQRVNDYQSDQPDFMQYNNQGERAHTFQIDYAQPFKILTLEAGAKAILRNDFSNFNRSDLDSATNVYVFNPRYTDVFSYQQNVYSLYNSYQFKFDKWTAKAGLRLEHTSINGDFATVNATINQGYNNLIPSVSIQRSFKTSSYNFGFTQRIQRPGIFQLNPFVDTSNPLFISTGNPNLRPELNNTFELNYSNFAASSFNVGLSYQFSNNSIQNVSSLRRDTAAINPHDTTFTTYRNLGSNSSLGLNVNTNLNITKKLSLSLNGFITKIWLRGTYNGQFYQNNGFTGNAFANAGYKFDNGFRVGIDAGFFSGDVNLQGHSSAFIYNSLVLTKEFLNKKATISLVANDPESKYHNNTSTTTTSQYYQYSLNQDPYRTFAVRFSYKIGKLNSEIKKNQHGINNDDTKGGGKSGGGSGG
ncbi:TonB-dependent receptor domain-containing protein [Mucilaginibacter sp.]|uniref:TonB-dependent receptor domain-containing protein n=1 Tax=Mucilaginibacter sp. TaxID=1882438 RepID=UPI002846ED5A|nr:TonB-dependent receptor [Mucilaginibacter sp.]MDR3695129.1 TonB-dependent receptor [Mucilaginibacter sp.]